MNREVESENWNGCGGVLCLADAGPATRLLVVDLSEPEFWCAPASLPITPIMS